MRKPRKLEANVKYHVVARVNRRELILNSSDNKELFLSVLKRAKQKYKFDVYNFCIMGNHVHLIIKPFQDYSLSKIMQWILSVFAIKYNKRKGLIGHVWYDRFMSSIIKSYQQYLKTFIYIANNPVRAGLTDKAVDFLYNGIRFICNDAFEIIKKPSFTFLKRAFKDIR